jgi:rhodanese-related sulfurtransferase
MTFSLPVCLADEKAATTAPATRPAGEGVRRISVEEFDKMRAGKDAVVIDVRMPAEFAAGHVPGAVNIPIVSTPDGVQAFGEKVDALDKNKTYLVHCALGGRSILATRKMEALGFANVNDFSGGMRAWEKAEKPVEKSEKKDEKPKK